MILPSDIPPMMIPVTVSRDGDVSFLALWPLDRLDDLIPLLDQWGIYTNDEGPGEYELSATFRFTSGPMSFEIAIDPSS